MGNGKKRDSSSVKEDAADTSKKAKAAAKSEAVFLCDEDKKLAEKYVEIRKSSADKRFQWDKLGKNIPKEKRSKIRKYVRENKMLPEVKFVPGTKFPIFPPETIAAEIILPKELWNKGDDEQFEWLDKEYEKGMKEIPPKYKDKGTKAYTWHHHQDDGKMQLVEFGTHNRVKHEGGRTTWATGPR